MFFKKKFYFSWLVIVIVAFALCLGYNNLTAAQKVLVINNDAAKTNISNVNLNILPTQSNVTEMMVSNSSSFSGATWEVYAATKQWTLSSRDGEKKVYVKFKYGSRVSSYSYDNIKLDTTKPTGTVKISNGTEKTNKVNVTLSINAVSDTVEMQVSNTDSFDGAQWEKRTTSKQWTLTSGDGTKTVYVKLKDGFGNISDKAITDTIILDSGAPTGGSISINNGAEVANSNSIGLTISAQDAVKMKISNSGDFKGASWDKYATSKNWTLISGDGTKTVYVKFADSQGNESATYSDSILLDSTQKAKGTIIINNNVKLTNSTDVNLTITASADAKNMMLSNSKDFSSASWENISTTKTWTLTGGDGEKTVYIKFKDGIGVVSDAFNDNIKLDTVKPTGTVKINNGAEKTNKVNATLSISAVSDAVEMQVSNTDSFDGAQWEKRTTSKQWTLTSGDGTKTVYVKLKDEAGNVSAIAISDTIILDSGAPTGGSILINNGAEVATNKSILLTISAQDATKMKISNSVDFKGSSWEKYAASKKWTLTNGDGTKTVYVKFTDSQGNESTIYSDNIVLDTVVPTGKIVINNDSKSTNNSNVNLTLTALEDTKYMMISNDNKFTAVQWETYVATKQWVLASGNGTKTVYVKFKDNAGNISREYNDSIALNTTSPTGKLVINNGQASTDNINVSLTLSASSSAKEMLISNNKDFSAAQWEKYTSSKKWTLSGESLISSGDLEIVYIKFKDAEGNISVVYADVITIIR